ncbi:MAG: adenine deaminase C-terminal domain-containing protein [Dehalococcoidia bacterium]
MPRKRFTPSSQQIAELMEVAQGRKKADLAIVNARLVDVYTGEVLPDYGVAIKGERIAYVGPNPSLAIGPDTQVIDAAGRTLIPGLIDGHTHLMYFFTPYEFMKQVMAGGTTTVITESPELAFIWGYQGTLSYLASLRNQPMKIFITASPMVTLSPLAEAHAFGPKEIRALLRDEGVVGLGECYWLPAVQGHPRLVEIFAEVQRSGKVMEGHAAGARDDKLVAYIAAGFSADHEPISDKEIRERLRLGMHVLVRQGSIRKDLHALSDIVKEGLDLRRVGFGTDGFDPKDMLEGGYMESIVRQGIAMGIAPVTAVQMATLNTAEHFRLDHLIGGISPGKMADMLIIPSLEDIRAEYVISNGQITARDGKILIPPRKYHFPKRSFNSLQFPRRFTAEDFTIRTGKGDGRVKARVMDWITDLVTQEVQLDVRVQGGEIKADTEADILKAAVIERVHRPGTMAMGLVRGFKMDRGAFATSAAWDTGAITVVGVDAEDMAQAVNRVVELQGAAVVWADGRVMAEIPMPLGGFLTLASIEEIAAQQSVLYKAVGDLGVPFPDPHLSLTVLSCCAIPFFRMNEEGYADLRNNEHVPLLVD